MKGLATFLAILASGVDPIQESLESPPVAGAGRVSVSAAAPHALHEAARRGDLDALEAALEAGADVNEVRVRMAAWVEAHETPLFLAAREAHPDVVRVLLGAGADPNVRCLEGGTALTIAAARFGTADILRLLLAAGADVLGPRPKRISALGWSATSGDVESFCLLLEAARRAGLTAEEEASILERLRHRNDDLRPVLYRLLTWKEEEAPALHVATRLGTAADVETHLAAGATATVADAQGWTALHWAALAASDEKARMLLQAGADPNARTTTGTTPLLIAARHDPSPDSRSVRLLLDAGAAAEATDEDRRSALHVAAWCAGPERIWLLLDRGADPGRANRWTQTPRMVAEARKRNLGTDVCWAFDGRTRPAWATVPEEVRLWTDLPAPTIVVTHATVQSVRGTGFVLLQVTLALEPFPLDMAFDLCWRHERGTFPAQPIVVQAGSGDEYRLQIFGQGLEPGSTIELLLHPSAEVAVRRLPCPDAIWGADVRLRCRLETP